MADRVDPALVAAARRERDHRAKSYPRRIAAREIDSEAAAVDYQCWVAIAEWLETDRFFSFAGGADPDRLDAPIIRWPELEAAAAGALERVGARIVRMEDDPDQAKVDLTKRLTAEQWLDKLQDLYLRRARLTLIHRKVERMREHVDTINAEFRDRRDKAAA